MTLAPRYLIHKHYASSRLLFRKTEISAVLCVGAGEKQPCFGQGNPHSVSASGMGSGMLIREKKGNMI